MLGRLLVVNLVGDRFVNPGKFCCGIGNEFAGGPDKRADLFGGPRELGLAIAGWVIWATKAAAWFTEAAFKKNTEIMRNLYNFIKNAMILLYLIIF
jgi:hypothetical protein